MPTLLFLDTLADLLLRTSGVLVAAALFLHLVMKLPSRTSPTETVDPFVDCTF